MIRNSAFVAAVILVVVLFLGALYLVRGQLMPSTALASPTATSAATLVVATATAPSPTPSLTPSSLYVNSTYKFSVDLPSPYRKSLRAVNGTSTAERYQDAFSARTDAEEAAIDTSGCHTACPLWQYAAYVVVATGTGPQTTRDWYAKEEGGTTSQVIEDTLVGGRPAIRIANGARYTLQFVIKDGDRIVVVAYQIYGPENGMPVPAGASKEKLDAILASFKFLP